MSRSVRIGTRKSALAMWQAEWVASELKKHDVDVELIQLVTTGDVTQGPLSAAGGEGLFTKRIQQALLDDEADIAVHSLKDLPTEPTSELQLAAVPKREHPYDVMVSQSVSSLDALKPGSIVGTGSIRRQAQLLHAYPELVVKDIRGNVESRLKKLETEDYDAIILAYAGLHRLGLDKHVTQQLSMDLMLPAVGQGALGLETRAGDDESSSIARMINDPCSYAEVTAERALLRTLRAGCMAPVGCFARESETGLMLRAVVLSSDGKDRVTVQESGSMDSAAELGQAAAETLLAHGAEELMQRSRA